MSLGLVSKVCGGLIATAMGSTALPLHAASPRSDGDAAPLFPSACGAIPSASPTSFNDNMYDESHSNFKVELNTSDTNNMMSVTDLNRKLTPNLPNFEDVVGTHAVGLIGKGRSWKSQNEKIIIHMFESADSAGRTVQTSDLTLRTVETDLLELTFKSDEGLHYNLAYGIQTDMHNAKKTQSQSQFGTATTAGAQWLKEIQQEKLRSAADSNSSSGCNEKLPVLTSSSINPHSNKIIPSVLEKLVMLFPSSQLKKDVESLANKNYLDLLSPQYKAADLLQAFSADSAEPEGEEAVFRAELQFASSAARKIKGVKKWFGDLVAKVKATHHKNFSTATVELHMRNKLTKQDKLIAVIPYGTGNDKKKVVAKYIDTFVNYDVSAINIWKHKKSDFQKIRIQELRIKGQDGDQHTFREVSLYDLMADASKFLGGKYRLKYNYRQDKQKFCFWKSSSSITTTLKYSAAQIQKYVNDQTFMHRDTSMFQAFWDGKHEKDNTALLNTLVQEAHV